MAAIKTIIFDLGEVLIDLHPKRMLASFARLFGKPEEEIMQINSEWPVFNEFEIGQHSTEELRNRIRNELKVDFTDDGFDAAWWSLLGDIAQEKIKLINELRKTYKVHVLSNTNALHMAYIHNYVRHKYQLENLDVLFEKAYYSYQLGLRKPWPEIYSHVLDDDGLKANETLFIDDSIANIEAAGKLGINTIHLTDRNQLIPVVQQYLA